MDPAYGNRHLSKREFSAIFDGVVLVAIPHALIPRLPKSKSIQKELFGLLKNEKTSFLFLVILSIFIVILAIFYELYFKVGVMYGTILEEKKFKVFLSFFLVLLLTKLVLLFLKNKWKLSFDKNIDIRYLYAFVSHILKIPLTKFQTFHEGELITRVEEAKEMKDLFSEVCLTFFLESILGFGSFFVLFLLEWHLSFFVLGGMILYVFLGLLLSKGYYKAIKKLMDSNRVWNEMIMEKFHFFKTMKHLNEEKYVFASFEEKLSEIVLKEWQDKKSILYFNTLKENFLEILFFGLTTYGLCLLKNNEVTILDFVTFQSLYLYFVKPFQELVDLAPKFYYLKGIFEKMNDTVDWPEEKIDFDQSPIPPPSIVIKDFGFSYHDYQEVITKFSMKVKAKEHVFFSGPSGCGKSTICKVLHKELSEYMGTILFSEKDLEDYTLSEIRSSVVYLSQKESILEGTIRENILLNKEDEKRFLEVAKVCLLEDILKNKPLRYESVIHEELLSGGEKQRIMLARTLMKEGSLYLLDECLSEVEEEKERMIIKNIRKFLKGKTLIYVSHRNLEKEFERSIHFENQKHVS